MSRVMLKIKIAALAAEEKIIRREVLRKVRGRRRDREKFRKALSLSRERSGSLIRGAVGDRPPRDLRSIDEKTVHSMEEHRRLLGQKARSAHLAMCAIRGTPYRLAETNPESIPDFQEINDNIRRFGEFDVVGQGEVVRWFREAAEHLLSLPEEGALLYGGMAPSTWKNQVKAGAARIGIDLLAPKVVEIEKIKAPVT